MSSNNRVLKFTGELIIEISQIIADVLVVLVKVLYAVILSIINLIIPNQPKSVNGEIVLVTGAGHGIGKELALAYASQGATVIGWDINEKNGFETVKEIEKLGYPKAYFYLCDVSNRNNVLSVAKEVQKDVGEVTILINNAGIMPTHPLTHHTKDEIERIMNINVLAHFWTLEAFLPTMKQNNYGHIVALSSTAGMFGIPNLVPYCTSKFAVRGLMESLREELRRDKKCEIKLTTIYPFIVNTGLCKKPIIRFENLMPIVNSKDAAKEIMAAQRNNVTDMTIPRYFTTLNTILRWFPVRAQHNLMDFIGVGLESDLS